MLPVHLHGHHFHVLYKGREDDGSIDFFKLAVASFNNKLVNPPGPVDADRIKRFFDGMAAVTPQYPMKRDTLMAEKFQFLVVAFVADNPGVWALHCHNDFHAATGMMRQIVAAPAELRKNLGTYSVPGGILQDNTVPYKGLRTDWMTRNIQQCAA